MFLLKLKKFFQIIFDMPLLVALFKGAAAGMEHRPVLESLCCEYIVDVGANRGQFALIARKVFPKTKIISIEPLDEASKIFKNVFSKDSNVIFHACAIGKTKKVAAIHVTKDDDSSSLLPITKMQSKMFPGTVEMETRQVMVYPLSLLIDDASIPSASLLKIDVQGYELEVLRGCEEILNKFSHLYLECSFIELYEGQPLAYQIIAWLKERNFYLSGVYNLYYDKTGSAIQGDFLFAPSVCLPS